MLPIGLWGFENTLQKKLKEVQRCYEEQVKDLRERLLKPGNKACRMQPMHVKTIIERVGTLEDVLLRTGRSRKCKWETKEVATIAYRNVIRCNVLARGNLENIMRKMVERHASY